MNRDKLGRFLPKQEISVKDAVQLAYDKCDTVFHGIIFVMDVRRMVHRDGLMDGTIFRELRYLKKEGVLNYRCKNTELSIYEKLPIITKA